MNELQKYFDEENSYANYDRSQTFGYIRALIVVMRRLKEADDTVWLNDYTTMFDECWGLAERAGGLSILQKAFPECA